MKKQLGLIIASAFFGTAIYGMDSAPPIPKTKTQQLHAIVETAELNTDFAFILTENTAEFNYSQINIISFGIVSPVSMGTDFAKEFEREGFEVKLITNTIIKKIFASNSNLHHIVKARDKIRNHKSV